MKLHGSARALSKASKREREFKPRGDLAMRPEAIGLVWPEAPLSCELHDGVAVLTICGPLEHRSTFWGWFETYGSILSRFEGALQDEEVHAVMLKIDSPGGEVSGLTETVRRMRAMKAKYGKPVVAFADEEIYSAAYALACAADEIYLPESGGVGSVGVIATICDRTQMTKDMGLRVEVLRSGSRKADGHPDIPLTDDAIERVQARVDDLAEQFFALVAEARPMSVKEIRSLEAGVLYGQGAVDAGLADGVLSFEDVLSALCQEKPFDTSGSRPVDPEVQPTDRSGTKGTNAMGFAALEKKVTAAQDQLAKAKTPAARKAAARALAAAQQSLIEAKMKKKYKKVTEETESEERSPDDDEPADDDDDASASDAEGEGADEGAEDEGADEGAEDDEDSKKAFVGKVLKLTGATSLGRALGKLRAWRDASKTESANAERIAELEAERENEKRSALIAQATRDGRLTPGQKKWAAAQPLEVLQGYLDATPAAASAPRQPAVVRGGEQATQQQPNAATPPSVPAGALTDDEIAMCRASNVDPAEYLAHKTATGGKIAVEKMN